MLNESQIIDFLRKNGDPAQTKDRDILNAQQVYFEMSLHIDGVTPPFAHLIDTKKGWGAEGNLEVFRPNFEFMVRYQNIFDCKLLNRHPRESYHTHQWRLSQYKPFTKRPFAQVIQVVSGAVFQDGNYSIIVENDADNKYIWDNNFEGKSLAGYIREHFQDIGNDPNAYFIVKPVLSAAIYRANPSSPIAPGVFYVPSKRTLMNTPDELIWIDNGVWWVANREVYMRFEKRDGDIVNIDGKGGFYYYHDLGVVPRVKCGGLRNSQGYFDSWFDAAKAVADEYVSAKSAEQLVNKEASHPWITTVSEVCPACDGAKGKTWCTRCNVYVDECVCHDKSNYSLKYCNKCGGTGTVSHNPGEWLEIPYEKMKDNVDFIKITNPSVDINKFHAENNAALFDEMMKALHLFVVDEAQSGVAKAKDMETRYQFIVDISNDIFDRLLPTLLVYVTALRNVVSVEGVLEPAAAQFTIVKPLQFDIKTATDLLLDYDAAKKSGLPPFMLTRLLDDYVDKQFGGDDVIKRKSAYIIQTDKLAVMTTAETQQLIISGGADSQDVKYHVNVPQILDELIRRNGTEWFVTAPFDTIDQQVQALFKERFPPALSLPPDGNMPSGA